MILRGASLIGVWGGGRGAGACRGVERCRTPVQRCRSHWQFPWRPWRSGSSTQTTRGTSECTLGKPDTGGRTGANSVRGVAKKRLGVVTFSRYMPSSKCRKASRPARAARGGWLEQRGNCEAHNDSHQYMRESCSGGRTLVVFGDSGQLLFPLFALGRPQF